MPASRALSRSVETLLEADGANGERYVDLGISLRVCDTETDEHGNARWLPETDEELLVVGGRFDRREKVYAGKPSKLIYLRLHRGQEESGRWIAEWVRRMALGKKGPQWRQPMPGGTPKIPVEQLDGAAHLLAAIENGKNGDGRDYALLLIGGRRSGKSHMSLVLLVLYAVMTANALIWAISPTQPRTNELRRALMALMPPRWYRFHRGSSKEPPHFLLINGSRIDLVSGHKSEALKNGGCDLALYNEAQNMSLDGFAQIHGAIGDSGGLIVLAANPPSKPIGRWVEELFDYSRAGRNATQTFQLSPRNNPFIDYGALVAAARNLMDPITFRREILGEMLPIGDVVFHSWSSNENVRVPPDHFIDVTAEVTKRILGHAAGYVVGMDFQKKPHNAAVIYKFFRDPKATDPTDVLAWVVDECVCEDSDEFQLLDALEAMPRWRRAGKQPGLTYRGWIDADDDPLVPVHCAVVMDASAWFQSGAHDGNQSDRMLRSRGWKYLYQPQPWRRKDGGLYRNNPRVVERCQVANALMCNADKMRRKFVSPHCNKTIRALKNWGNNKVGLPDRTSPFAHVCDADTYPLYRFFAKVMTAKLEVKPVGGFTSAQEFAQI